MLSPTLAWQLRALQKPFPIINSRIQVIGFFSRRHETTANHASVNNPEEKAETSLFIDSIFPVQLGIWEYAAHFYTSVVC